MKPLISSKTISELQEYFVETSLRVIAQEFDAAGIERDEQFLPQVKGERRRLFQQYLHTLDLRRPRDVRKLLDVFGSVLSDLEPIKENVDAIHHAFAARTFDLLSRLLKRDGYQYHEGRVSAAGRATSLDELQDAISPLDLPHLQQQIDRMRDAADADPWLAIGTAKELVETVCKTILRERSIQLSGKPEIPELLRAARDALKLLPEQVPNASKGAETVKRLLSNLGTIAQNLAELRRDYGTGHGQDGRARGLHPRHARLAVNSAVALVTFLIETHLARSQTDVGTRTTAPTPDGP